MIIDRNINYSNNFSDIIDIELKILYDVGDDAQAFHALKENAR